MGRKKILYGINGTGQGHISRAKSLIPYLRQYVDVDVLISGKMQSLNFEEDIKYEFSGFTFVYEGGAVNWIKTVLNAKPIAFLKDIFTTNFKQYDLIVTDFEPVSAWCALLHRKNCINVSHQSSFYTTKSPRPKTWPLYLLPELFLRLFAISTDYIGVHFKRYNNKIFPPILKDEIIQAKTSMDGHITVYLAAFSLKQQVEFFQKFPNYQFQIFHRQCNKKQQLNNLSISPLCETFKYSLISCSGYISNAGFESNAEALYLKKPLVCIPIRHQYEQYCNGAALKKMGVTVLSYLKYKPIKKWLENRPQLESLEVSNTDELAKAIVSKIKP